jgi:ABC-2 type transport system ATP-binding protein
LSIVCIMWSAGLCGLPKDGPGSGGAPAWSRRVQDLVLASTHHNYYMESPDKGGKQQAGDGSSKIGAGRLEVMTSVEERVQQTAAVSVRGLVKTYGEVQAVRGIDLEVHTGETFGFLGPNGAGKSTTISMLCTLLTPTAGTAEVAGFDVVHQRDQVRRHIGLVFQEQTLDGYLTAQMNLRLHGELYGVPTSVLPDRIELMLKMVGLWERRKSKVNTFSGGMRRRLEIARGLLHSPRVLFLDEPTVGLDPQTRASIWSYIQELKATEDITMFMTTHYMDEAEYCDRIAIMDNGQIIALDTPEALKASVGKDRIRITTGDDTEAIRLLKERFGLDVTKSEGELTFSVEEGEHFVPRLFSDLPLAIRSVNVARPTLDDVFMTYTGRTIRDAEASSSEVNKQQMKARLGRRN